MKRSTAAGTLGGIVVLALATTAPVWASHTFSDVPTDATHHAAVERLEASSITEGCTPTSFCPDDAVRRSQMALFLDRISGKGDVAPSVNAATLHGLTPEQLRGQTGPAGPRGPSSGYFARAGFTPAETFGQEVTVASRDVPAGGLFLTTAKASVYNEGETTVFVVCSLGARGQDQGLDESYATVTPDDFATLTLLHELDTTGTPAAVLDLRCTAFDDGDPPAPDGSPALVEFGFAAISTVQVGELAVSEPEVSAQRDGWRSPRG